MDDICRKEGVAFCKCESELHQKEEALFCRWKNERKHYRFIKDGVCCPRQWEKEKVKILFVLKDANNPDKEDLRDMIMTESSSTYWKTWNNIARWTKAILERGEYNDVRKVTKGDKTKWLSKISFINLKKASGDKSADEKEIEEFAKDDSHFIMEQIDLYKPNIIICCGRNGSCGSNAELLYKLLREYVLPKERLSDWGKNPICGFNYFHVKLSDMASQTPVISFVHPQKRGASHEDYESWFKNLVEITEVLLPIRN